MGFSSLAAGLIYVSTEELPLAGSPDVQSGYVAEIVDLQRILRARVVTGSDGRRRLEYEKDSFWALLPVDLGDLRSDRLDDFLYGGQ